ncbi:eukaryotic initiation factor 4E [Toxoplasma gondii GAB2-2007-GAL-DOM2]|uniref:Eukaryotic initiation factor 4E n=3 Tax=Toxoplasma gondii TaxID=5811 RepID=A0A086LH99_TOXGO|nr:eukaryotic initiation factor 4E [Toxoplasma gondii GAB2-2007-GAL-DOM2]KFG56017.1 eukaryotic initiation factor 4E [Toxoplasma gondii FOU]PUA91693.1 eukaryotic initiation factor 4E [Toxoplasma gondii TgCATBr9]
MASSAFSSSPACSAPSSGVVDSRPKPCVPDPESDEQTCCGTAGKEPQNLSPTKIRSVSLDGSTEISDSVSSASVTINAPACVSLEQGLQVCSQLSWVSLSLQDERNCPEACFAIAGTNRTPQCQRSYLEHDELFSPASATAGSLPSCPCSPSVSTRMCSPRGHGACTPRARCVPRPPTLTLPPQVADARKGKPQADSAVNEFLPACVFTSQRQSSAETRLSADPSTVGVDQPSVANNPTQFGAEGGCRKEPREGACERNDASDRRASPTGGPEQAAATENDGGKLQKAADVREEGRTADPHAVAVSPLPSRDSNASAPALADSELVRSPVALVPATNPASVTSKKSDKEAFRIGDRQEAEARESASAFLQLSPVIPERQEAAGGMPLSSPSRGTEGTTVSLKLSADLTCFSPSLSERTTAAAMTGTPSCDLDSRGSFSSDVCKQPFSGLSDASPLSHSSPDERAGKAGLVCCSAAASNDDAGFLSPGICPAGHSLSTTESAGSIRSPSTPPRLEAESPEYGLPRSLSPEASAHQRLPTPNEEAALPSAYAARCDSEELYVLPTTRDDRTTPKAVLASQEEETPMAGSARRRWASFDVQDSDTDLFDDDTCGESDLNSSFGISEADNRSRLGSGSRVSRATARLPRREAKRSCEGPQALQRLGASLKAGRGKGKPSLGADRTGRKGGVDASKESAACGPLSIQRAGDSHAFATSFAGYNRFSALSNGEARSEKDASQLVHAGEEARTKAQGARERGRQLNKGHEAEALTAGSKNRDERDSLLGDRLGKASGDTGDRLPGASLEGFELFRNTLTLQLLQGRELGVRFVEGSEKVEGGSERKQREEQDEGWVVAGRKRKPVAEAGGSRRAGREVEGKGRGKRDERPVEWIAWLDPCTSAANVTTASTTGHKATASPSVSAVDSVSGTEKSGDMEKGAYMSRDGEDSAQDGGAAETTEEPVCPSGRKEGKEGKGKSSGADGKSDGCGGAVSLSKQLQEEYEQGLERVGRMSSWTAVSPFLAWWLPASASRGNLHNLCFFKNPVKPLWEHPENIKGGHFALRRFAAKTTVQEMFLLLASTVLKDESVGAVRHCNGIVLCIRHHWRKHKIEFWTASLDSGVLAQQEGLLRRLLSQLPGSAGHGVELEFISHREVVQRNQVKLMRARGKAPKAASGKSGSADGFQVGSSSPGISMQKPFVPRSSFSGSEIAAPPLLPEGPFAPGTKKKINEKRSGKSKHCATGGEQNPGECADQESGGRETLSALGKKASACEVQSSQLDNERSLAPRHGPGVHAEVDDYGREQRGETLTPTARQGPRKKDSKGEANQTEKKRPAACEGGTTTFNTPRSARGSGDCGSSLLREEVGEFVDAENRDGADLGSMWTREEQRGSGIRGRGPAKSGGLPALMQSPLLLSSETLPFPGRLPVWAAGARTSGPLSEPPQPGNAWEEEVPAFSGDSEARGLEIEAQRESEDAEPQFGGSGPGGRETLCQRLQLWQPEGLVSTESSTVESQAASTSPLIRPGRGYPRQIPPPGRRGMLGSFLSTLDSTSWSPAAQKSGAFANGGEACAADSKAAGFSASSTASRWGGDPAFSRSRHVEGQACFPAPLAREEGRPGSGLKAGKSRGGMLPGSKGAGPRRGARDGREDLSNAGYRSSGRGASRGPSWSVCFANEEEQRRRLATTMVARIDVKSIPDYFSMQLAANLGGTSIGSAAALQVGVGGSLTAASSPLGFGFLAQHSGVLTTLTTSSSTHTSEGGAGTTRGPTEGGEVTAGPLPGPGEFKTGATAPLFPLLAGAGIPLPDGFSPQLLASPSVGRAVATVLQVQQLPFSPVMESVQQQLGLLPPKKDGDLELQGMSGAPGEGSARGADSLQDLCLPPLLGSSALARPTSPMSSPSAVSPQELLQGDWKPGDPKERAARTPEQAPCPKRPFAFNPQAAVFRPSWSAEGQLSEGMAAPQGEGEATAYAEEKKNQSPLGETETTCEDNKAAGNRRQRAAGARDESEEFAGGRQTIAAICHALPAAAHAVEPRVHAGESHARYAAGVDGPTEVKRE